MMKMKKCLHEACPGKPRHTRITETYESKRSPVVVTIQNIPAVSCPACGYTTIDDETYAEIERLLDLFQKSDPPYPPARVEIDYKPAVKMKRVA
jgi:hypothetical protein